MQLDSYSTFSNKQEIVGTGSIYSEHEMGSNDDRDVGPGAPVYLYTTCTEDFLGATSLTVTLEHSDTEDFAVVEDKMSSGQIPVADLMAGEQLLVGTLPHEMKQFMRIRYDVAGTSTQGRVYAGLTMNQPPVRRNYPDRLSLS